MPREATARVFSQEFKVAAVKRFVAGERVAAVADELTVKPQVLYRWWKAYDRDGAAALGRRSGRPRGPSAQAQKASPGRVRSAKRRAATAASPEATRMAELEQTLDTQARKIGEQALEIDFFNEALRHIEASRRRNAGRGATPSSP